MFPALCLCSPAVDLARLPVYLLAAVVACFDRGVIGFIYKLHVESLYRQGCLLLYLHLFHPCSAYLCIDFYKMAIHPGRDGLVVMPILPFLPRFLVSARLRAIFLGCRYTT